MKPETTQRQTALAMSVSLKGARKGSRNVANRHLLSLASRPRPRVRSRPLLSRHARGACTVRVSEPNARCLSTRKCTHTR